MSMCGEYEPSTVRWIREQVDLYERTNGAEGNTLENDPTRPVVILTSRGARSGKIRKTPVMRIEHAGIYAVVAAVLGAPRNPSWYHNLLAYPEVELQDRETVHSLRAREGRGTEKVEWVGRIDTLYPWYQKYRDKAAEAGREIPVFILDP
jgi:deazaflavin-dependent oxidoreductase (nitroreductase family)